MFAPVKTEQHIGDVLSVFTKVVLYPRTLADVLNFCHYMTGQRIEIYQLDIAFNECRPRLIEYLPQLDSPEMREATDELHHLVEISEDLDDFQWATEYWLDQQMKIYGDKILVQALPNSIIVSNPTFIIYNGYVISSN